MNDTSCSFRAHNIVYNASKVNYICLTNCILIHLKQLISTRHSKRVPWLKTKQNKHTDRYGNIKMNLAKECMSAHQNHKRSHSFCKSFLCKHIHLNFLRVKKNQLINTIPTQWNRCIQISEQFSLCTFRI